MKNTIGLTEINSIAKGMEAADLMLKASEVELLQAIPVCPGKYIIIIAGDLSAVSFSIEACRKNFESQLIDSFVIGNLSPGIFSALSAVTELKQKRALGIIETFTAASSIEAADSAVKAAVVNLVEIRIARGMGGKSFVLLEGNVADVEAAVKSGCEIASKRGALVSFSVIPNPHSMLWEAI